MRALLLVIGSCLLVACMPAPPAAQSTKNGGGSTKSDSPNSSSSSTGACGPITARGQCQSVNGSATTVLQCTDGSLVKDDCSLRGLACTVDPSVGATCTSPASKSSGSTPTTGSKSGGTSGTTSGSTNGTQPCGTVPKDGVCAGNTLKWCFNNKLFTQDCTVDKGATCKTNGSSATCTLGSVGVSTASTGTTSSGKTPCGAVTSDGICDGNTLKWCYEDNLLPIDCTVDPGWTCKVSSGSATCVPPGSDGSDCGSITYEGECSGTTLTYCDDGKKAVIDCSEGGGTCQTWAGNSDCAYSGTGSGGTSGDCGDVPATGICDGNVRTWCEGGLLHTDPCDPFNSYCDYSAEGAVFCNYAMP